MHRCKAASLSSYNSGPTPSIFMGNTPRQGNGKLSKCIRRAVDSLQCTSTSLYSNFSCAVLPGRIAMLSLGNYDSVVQVPRQF